MRGKHSRTGLNLSAVVSAQQVVQPHDPGVAVRMHAARDGAKAAAWLIWQCRKLFERTGEVDFKVPVDVETPPYVRVAVAFLELSPKHRTKWGVVVFKDGVANDERRVYRIRWRDHAYYRHRRETGQWPASKPLGRSPTDPGGAGTT